MKETKQAAKNKNTENSSPIVFLVFIILGGICGYLGVKITEGSPLRNTAGVRLLSYLILMLYIIIAMYIHLIVHEAGHFLAGKISGYQFVSFRIGKRMLINENGTYKFKKYTIVGTGGQCLMMPPECDGYDYPNILYNLGGVIANIILSCLSLFLYFILPKNIFFSVTLLILFFIGITFALTNGLPFCIGGIGTDGYNAFSMRKDKNACHAFWLQLYTNGLLSGGRYLRDMPAEWFEIPDDFDWNNSMNCSTGVLRFSYLQDKKESEEAIKLGTFLLETASGTLELHKKEIRCELLYYEITGLCRKEEIEKYYTKELQQYIKATSSYVSRKRLMYAYYLLVEQDPDAAQKELKAFEKTARTYPYSGEIESERNLILAINKAATEA